MVDLFRLASLAPVAPALTHVSVDTHTESGRNRS